MALTGKVFKFGDNIDTDVIIPARYLVTTDPAALAEHCMEDVSAAFAKEVRKGDIIVGGSNFGCGSSREQAVLAIMGCGVKVVLAESFARIFYRNCINRGLYALEVSKATLDRISQGEVISVDLERGEITREGSAEAFDFKPISDDMKRIVAAGGIIPYTRQRIAKEV